MSKEDIERILIKIRTGKEVTIGDDTIIENLLNNYLREKARADKLEKEYSKMLTKIDEYEVEKQQDKDKIQELGEINFNLLNNRLPKELFYELQEKLKKEKQENEANKKRIEEIIQKLDIDIERNKRKKIEHNTEDDIFSSMLIVYEPEIIKEVLEELLKDGGE